MSADKILALIILLLLVAIVLGLLLAYAVTSFEDYQQVRRGDQMPPTVPPDPRHKS